jgi:hypothetical protein
MFGAPAAHLNASSGTPTQEGEEAILKRRATDAMHSRRKHGRRLGEFHDLQQECNQLSNNIVMLKAEQARLQGLLDRARREHIVAF